MDIDDDDNNEKSHKDIIVIPLIYTAFCLCVSIGGVLLAVHVFFPAQSRPWQPIAALVLIGSTWIFWILTYIYAFINACFLRRDADRRQIPARQTTRTASTATAAAPKDGGGRGGGKQDSVASSNGSEIPLAYV